MEINAKTKIVAVKIYFAEYKKRAEYVRFAVEPSVKDVEEAETWKRRLTALIAELGYCEERNVIERMHIHLQTSRKVCKEMGISESHRRNLYNRGMLKLYDILEGRKLI